MKYPKFKDNKFKGTRVEVDSIYLTKDDLSKIMSADLSSLSNGHEHARDIFMVGVWTAQRISDYNNISRENIKHHRIPKLIDNRHPSEEYRSKDIHSCEQRTKKHIRTL